MRVITHQEEACDESWEIWRPGVETRMLISAKNGASELCIFEQKVAPGAGAPTHRHPVEEVLTVCEGEAEMWIEQDRMAVSAGRSLIIPARARARFSQQRNADAACPRGAGLADLRGYPRGDHRGHAPLAGAVTATP